MSEREPAALHGRAVRAIAWGYGGSFARMGIQIAAQAVLARLLGPQEFGVFAALMLLIGVSVLAADLVSAPIIQAPALDEATLRFACGVQWLGSGGIALLSLAALPLFEQTFPQISGLGWSLAMVASGIFATGWGGVSLSLLRRGLRYREIQLAQLAGYVAGYVVVAVPLAWAGMRSHHVLVIAWLIQAVLSALLQYGWARHPLGASLRLDDWRRFLRYGGEVSVGNVANWLSTSVDRLLVARQAAPVDIGYYNTMLNLMSTPVSQLSSSLNTVAFSVSAQSGDEARRVGTLVYLNVTTWLFGLLYAVFAAAPQLWVHWLYGSRWLDAAAYLPPFCVAAVGFGLSAAANAMLTSTGQAGSSAASQLATVVLLAAAVWWFVERSVLWAAWSVAAVYLLRALLLAWLSLRRVGEGVARLWQTVGVPLLLALGQVVLSQAAANGLRVPGLGPTMTDLLGILAGLCAMLVCLALARRLLVPAVTRVWVAEVWLKLRRRLERHPT
jgi:O-antigen/teichoic acid export membrane protein